MGRLKNNEKGYSAVELVLIVVILAIIGVVAWYVRQSTLNSTSTLDNAQGEAGSTAIFKTKKSASTTQKSTTGSTSTNSTSNTNSSN